MTHGGFAGTLSQSEVEIFVCRLLRKLFDPTPSWWHHMAKRESDRFNGCKTSLKTLKMPFNACKHAHLPLLFCDQQNSDNGIPVVVDFDCEFHRLIQGTSFQNSPLNIPMKPRLKTRTLHLPVDRDIPNLAETSKKFLQCCIMSIHELTRRYYYRISAEESVPGTLSYLLSMREVDLSEIFKICGFLND